MFAELGVEYLLPRRSIHHARTSEEARGGEISGVERAVSLVDERTPWGAGPTMKWGRKPNVTPTAKQA